MRKQLNVQLVKTESCEHADWFSYSPKVIVSAQDQAVLWLICSQRE